MTTKKALKKENAALKAELAQTKMELEAARYSANSSHLYREHCVQNWLEADREIKRLELENSSLRAENRRYKMGQAAVASFETAKEYYCTNKANESEVQ